MKDTKAALATVRQPRSESPRTATAPSLVKPFRIHDVHHTAAPSIAAKPVHRINRDGVMSVDVSNASGACPWNSLPAHTRPNAPAKLQATRNLRIEHDARMKGASTVCRTPQLGRSSS
jgi:hypothetical protein